MSTWRYLTADNVDADHGLAGDEAVMLGYGRGQTTAAYAADATTEATLRLYTYRAHCALVGRYQSLEDEIDLEFCRQHDVQTGRRPTGGGAIIMGPDQLGVAVAARSLATETPRQALRRYARGVQAGLANLGIEAHFRSKNDLEVEGRKIAGLGLYLDPQGAILFHASVLVDLDVSLMLQVLRIPGAKLIDKAASRVAERVTTVSEELGKDLSALDVRAAFASGLAAALEVDLESGTLNPAESRRQADLVTTKFGSEEWVMARSPRRDARGTSILKTPAGLLRFYVGTHGHTIKSLLVAGDFNILPQGITRLEAALKWSRADKDSIASLTREALASGHDIASSPTAGPGLGVEPAVIAAAIWQATAHSLQLEERGHPERRDGSCYFPEPAKSTKNAESATHTERSS